MIIENDNIISLYKEVRRCSHLWKNEKFTVTKKIFRQINSVVFSLVKTVLSRNFCQKSVTVNFRNFHTVLLSLLAKISSKQRFTKEIIK